LVMLPKDGGGVYWEAPTAARAAVSRTLNISSTRYLSKLEEIGDG
jgi:hypothetical protein